MRSFLFSAVLLLGTASCVSPSVSPGPLFAEFVSLPPFEGFGPILLPSPAQVFGPLLPVPPPGRLTLSNFSFANAHVQAVMTGYPDCAVRERTATSDFVLPLNGTRIIETALGADVCWRREIEPGTAPGAAPSTPGWTEWNRAFVASRRSVDSRL